MPLEIIRLLAFQGPNILAPQPGVLLQARADRDQSRRLRSALRDAAQGAGIVLGALDVEAQPAGAGQVLTASFTTPTPEIGAAVARYVVEGLNAQEAGDESWDAEGRLWELRRRWRAEALPAAALRLVAEAAVRGVPAFTRADGALQLGYGARSLALDPAALAVQRRGDAAPAGVPWERIGVVPVIALAGGAGRTAGVALLAAELRARGERVVAAASAGFDAARALLADQSAEMVVVGLEAADLLRRGLAFERCAACAVLGLPDALPPDAAGPAELARALGLPMLVTDTDGLAVLAADAPEVAALAEFAPCQVERIAAPGGDAERLGELAARAILSRLTLDA